MTQRMANKRNRAPVAKKNAATRAQKPDSAKRPGGKLGLILERLEGKTGVTVDELVDATGWQKHSVRGALSRLGARGFAVQSEAQEDRKVYRLAQAGS
ncbi:MAG: DUF3489 domain-containing protein [Hyphomicrobiales bacterium]|nr:DUF3489 domain-containing protein [Hyphomicrobiales bacterium]